MGIASWHVAPMVVGELVSVSHWMEARLVLCWGLNSTGVAVWQQPSGAEASSGTKTSDKQRGGALISGGFKQMR